MRDLNEIKRILTKFKKGVKEISKGNLKRMILFGSYARGEAIEGSDIDILLIFEKEPAPQERNGIRELANSLSLKYDIVVAEFLLTEMEFQKYRTPFLLNVKKESMLL